MSADATNDGWFATMHLIHMLLQIILDFELLLANRADILEATSVFPYKVIL